MSRSSEFLKAVEFEKLEAENAQLRADNKVLRDALDKALNEGLENPGWYKLANGAQHRIIKIAREALEKTKENGE